MKSYFICLTCALLYLLSANVRANDSATPNILMIVIDDQNDWVGCLGGHPLASTPAIDELAKRGTLFSNAHCQAPLCNPSRTSVMTGLRPSSTGVYGLMPQHWSVDVLRERMTLPRALKSAGYQTAAVGKIYHSPPREEELKQREFDIWGPSFGVGAKPNKKLIPDTPPHNNPLMDWGTFDHEDSDKGDYKTADWAIQYLKESRDPSKPFFLSVGFFLPHVPCYVTDEWYQRVPDNDQLLPTIVSNDRSDTPRFSWYLHWSLPEPRLAWLEKENQWRNLCRSYLASTSFVDAQIGRILATLDQLQLRENTIVVLWSDHGYHLGEKEISGKNTLWERSTRVPLVFVGPGVTPGQVCSRPAELLDIFPTLMELTKSPKVDGLEGHSLLPQLANSNAERSFPAISTHNRNNHAVRSETHRYIVYADGSEELYDLSSDPHEWNNLIDTKEASAIVAELKKHLPMDNLPMVENSSQRTLQYDAVTDTAIWEGQPIHREDPIPAQ